MKSSANFEYVAGPDAKGIVSIIDTGPWDKNRTITNDAEDVVRRVLEEYPNALRIVYYDSERNLEELKFKGGEFVGFAPFVP